MLDVENIIKTIVDNYDKFIFVSKFKENVVITTKKELDAIDEDSPMSPLKAIKFDIDEEYKLLDFYDKEEIGSHIIEFLYLMEDDLSVSLDIGTKFPNKKFLKVINSLECKDYFYQYMTRAFSKGFYDWARYHGFIESEADKDIYKDIRKLLGTLKSKNYKEKFSDSQLFHLTAFNNDVHFAILGNAGIVNGISYYLDDYAGNETHLAVLDVNNTRNDPYTFNSLINIASFYFEDEIKEDRGLTELENPYDKDKRFTSIVIYPGLQKHNYLDKSLAYYLRDALDLTIKFLDRFVISKGYQKCEIGYDQLIDLDEDDNDYKYAVRDLDSKEVTEYNYPYDIDEDDFYEPPHLRILIDDWSFTIRQIRDYLADERDDRIIHFPYVAMFVNEKNEKIEMMIISGEKMGRPMSELSEKICDYFVNEKDAIASHIYVNNDLDYAFISRLLEEEINKKKVKIIYTDDELVSDKAFEIFVKQFQMMDDDEYDA